MIDQFKPGQKVRLTVLKTPRAENGVITIERLLRLDPVTKRGLRKAHQKRARTTIVFNRGNRDWIKRQTCAKIVQAAPGRTATIAYSHNLAPDLKSVAKYLKVEPA